MVDYSKWKKIEISDDEDETHPNIDTPSLYRWRHQARVERMEEHKKEVEEHDKKKTVISTKIKDAKQKLTDAEKSNADNLSELKNALDALVKEDADMAKKAQELDAKEKKQPWNVDTISKQGFTKTVINKKPARPKDEHLSEEERETRMKKFIKENEKDLKTFGMFKRYDDSREFLKAHNHLVCENTANYLVIWCINLEMEQKHDLMQHVAHQTICMQYILELAKQLDYDPRACLDAFFTKIQVAEPEYKASFDDELAQFKQRIRKRAAEKIDEAIAETEAEERKTRLGPGGLDPLEIFETLPDELKKCFESQDVGLLQETIGKMKEEDARYHMKRCVDSGLWVPDANKGKDDGDGDAEGEATGSGSSSASVSSSSSSADKK